MYLLAEGSFELAGALITLVATVGGSIAWLIRTYAPKFIDNHLEFVKAVEAQGERQTTALETLAGREALETKTHEALRHGANAAAAVVEGTPHESRVMPHIVAMRKTLGS